MSLSSDIDHVSLSLSCLLLASVAAWIPFISARSQERRAILDCFRIQSEQFRFINGYLFKDSHFDTIL